MRKLSLAVISVLLLPGFGCSAAGSESESPDASGGAAAEGTGGETLGSGGTGGMSTGGAVASGGAGTGGVMATGGVGTGGTGAGGGSSLPPLVECDTPSIDRLQEWLASGEGPTTPATGSLLVPEGDGYVAQATFNSASEWHVLAIWFGNEFGASIDFTGSTGFTLTYSATADFYIQLRPAAQWSGGAKWHMAIPSTAGATTTTFFPFEASAWEEVLGPPPHTLAEAMSDASGFAVVGNVANELRFHSLRVDGFTPTCL